MNERLTDSARRAISLANEQATVLRHGFVDTGHLLYGVAAEGKSGAAAALAECKVDAQRIVDQIQLIETEQSTNRHGEMLPFDADAHQAQDDAVRISSALGLDEVGPEPLLLALIARSDLISVRILTALECDVQQLHSAILRRIGASSHAFHAHRWADRHHNKDELASLAHYWYRQARAMADAAGVSMSDLEAALREANPRLADLNQQIVSKGVSQPMGEGVIAGEHGG